MAFRSTYWRHAAEICITYLDRFARSRGSGIRALLSSDLPRGGGADIILSATVSFAIL